MPHVVVKMYPGRSEDVKARMAEAITRDIVDIAACGEEWVSVAIEEVDPAEWPEKVYRPEILDRPDSIYKQPGYNPFE
ncbi:MAG: tautomerase family protein [Kiritimatiellae bacterium]|nr:tautomerase family protein [Kiritimatiellia bacterium]